MSREMIYTHATFILMYRDLDPFAILFIVYRKKQAGGEDTVE